MRKTLPLLLIGLVFLSEYALAGDSLRCGTRLVQRNDLAILVLERCGQPLSQEIIGYTLEDNRYANRYSKNRTAQREFKIEQWLYGPQNGYYNEIIFVGGKVREINRIRR